MTIVANVPLDLERAERWRPPEGWERITTVESHAAGEPLRVITGGLAPIPGRSMIEKRRFARERLDGLRRTLMFEPRGHADMYGAVPTEPVTPDGDLGVLFCHNEGWSTMCGHGVIALATVATELGLVSPANEIALDTPAGRVLAHLRRDGARVRSVAFENVPSFVLDLDLTVDVPGIGTVSYDLAFGGAFYAFVDAASVGLEMTAERFRDLIVAGTAIKRAVMRSREVPHPREPELSFLYGTIFTGPALSADADSRNVCVFAEGEVDRSPTGTGVSARVAIERARGRLALGTPFVVESIIGTRFVGRAIREVRWEGRDAVIPEVEGSGYVTGRVEIFVDPNDPLREGFILR